MTVLAVRTAHRVCPRQVPMLERRLALKDEEMARVRMELNASTQQLAEAQRSMSRIATNYQVLVPGRPSRMDTGFIPLPHICQFISKLFVLEPGRWYRGSMADHRHALTQYTAVPPHTTHALTNNRPTHTHNHTHPTATTYHNHSHTHENITPLLYPGSCAAGCRFDDCPALPVMTMAG